MKILGIRVENFCSYKEFELDFSNLGLTLISGETGSGKSTVPDMVAWTLFGVTSKDGNADDVRSWNCEDPTRATLNVGTPQGPIFVNRIRGKSTENDLFYTEDLLGPSIRGKNLLETQKLLEKRLSVTPELYFTASYFHQFSKADTFFISKSNERRDLFEKIVDQSLAISIGEKSSEARKQWKKHLETLNKELAFNNGNLHSSQLYLEKSKLELVKWQLAKTTRLNELLSKSDGFEQNRATELAQLEMRVVDLCSMIVSAEIIEKAITDTRTGLEQVLQAKEAQGHIRTSLADLKATLASYRRELTKLESLTGSTCPTCLGPSNNVNRKSQIAILVKEINNVSCKISEKDNENAQLQGAVNLGPEFQTLLAQAEEDKDKQREIKSTFDREFQKMTDLQSSDNKYLEQITELKSQDNPFEVQIEELTNIIKNTELLINDLKNNIKHTEHRITALSLLYDLSYELRGALLTKVIKEIETSTNACLERHFDSEVKVMFTLADSDKLEVEIQKSGNICNFKSLSGGQRCMLKLAFWLSVKKAAENKAGVSFDLLSFDETFTGLSDSLKDRCYGLLQELEATHSTILVIEHSESFKNNFTKEYKAEILGDESILTQVK